MIGMKIGAVIIFIILAVSGVIRINTSRAKRAVWGSPITIAILSAALVIGIISWLMDWLTK
ncbi:MAG: hypothetical protein LBT23_02290 [Synergistaceae bacterium]|nr:hypothetical protein [Synergistaceae bacterium]